MHSDRVVIFVRQMTELASQLSELEYLRNQVAEAQRRDPAVTIGHSSPNPIAKVRTNLIH